MIYFISDLHFGHKNCLNFDNRPFLTIEEQDEAIIKNWNKVVSKEDTVWILGDFSWYSESKTLEIFNKLNGTKNLVIGNHDEKLLKKSSIKALFQEIVPYKELKLEEYGTVVLSHYPIPCFNKHYYGAYHLYGHVHNSYEWNMMEHIKKEMEELYTVPCNMYNVGAMMSYMNYTPQSLKNIVEKNKK